jgi:hypothetical protein
MALDSSGAAHVVYVYDGGLWHASFPLPSAAALM